MQQKLQGKLHVMKCRIVVTRAICRGRDRRFLRHPLQSLSTSEIQYPENSYFAKSINVLKDYWIVELVEKCTQ